MSAGPAVVRPVRVQLMRTKGWQMPENTVKVDRSSRWGNPFLPSMICVSTSKEHVQGEPIGVSGAVTAFRTLMRTELKLRPVKTRGLLEALRGKNLACWCKVGEPCHADVLLELANAELSGPKRLAQEHANETK